MSNGIYTYKGIPLYTYCKREGIDYNAVIQTIYRNNKKGISSEESIEKAINTVTEGARYLYKGVSIVKIAKERNISVTQLRRQIRKKKKEDESRPLNEIVEEVVDNYVPGVKYKYKGKSLSKVCDELGIKYKTVLYKLRKKSVNDSNLDECIEECINDVLNKNTSMAKYYIEGETLYSYCKKRGINYQMVRGNVKEKKIESDKPVEDLLKEEVERVSKKESKTLTYRAFRKYKLDNNTNEDKAKELCKLIGIDYDSVMELVNDGLNYYQAINIIYYYSDTKVDGNLSISSTKLASVLRLPKYVNSMNVQNIRLIDLIRLYKCKLCDTREYILEVEKNYIDNLVFSYIGMYGLPSDASSVDRYKEFVRACIMEAIDKSYLNKESLLLNYIELFAREKFRTFVKKKDKSIILKPKKEKQGDN